MTPNELNAIYTAQSQQSSFFTDIMGIYNIKSYAAAGATPEDGTTDASTAINAAVAAADANGGGIIFFPNLSTGSTYYCGSNITFTNNITLWFADGAMLKPNSGVSITGTNTRIQAELYQIFNISLNGSINGTWDVSEAYPQWFGAVADGITDDTKALQNTFDLFYNIFLRQSTYLVSNRLTFRNGTTLNGGGSTIAPTVTFKTTATQTDDSKYAVIDMSENEASTDLKNVRIYDIIIDCANDITIDYGIYSGGSNRGLDFDSVICKNVVIGFYYNSIFIANFNKCQALVCSDTGFRIRGTSTDMMGCYTSTCDIGYLLEELTYSTLHSCASDFNRVGYQSSLSTISLISCGCEETDFPINFSSVTGAIVGGIYSATDNPSPSVNYLILIQSRSYVTLDNIVLADGAGVAIRKVNCAVTEDDGAIYILGCKGFGDSDITGNKEVRFMNDLRTINFGSSFSNTFLQLPIANIDANTEDNKLIPGGIYFNSLLNYFRVIMEDEWYNMQTATTGTTAQRPTNPPKGHQHYDGTLGIPIWWNGSLWIDATGASV